jgi:hypothetical protein
VVNSLFILRAQSGGNSSYKTTLDYIWARRGQALVAGNPRKCPSLLHLPDPRT